MSKSLRRLTGSLVLAASALSPLVSAQATVLDFEDPALTSVYLPGESFNESGFVFTQRHDAGVVDGAAALGLAAPTNNSTQFYSSLNDGYLSMSRSGGGGFNLDSFSAAYVPLIGSTAEPLNLVLVAFATTVSGHRFSTYFNLGDTTSSLQGSPFQSFSSALDFSQFKNLASVDFFTCAVGSGPICRTPTLNNAQFALDDIHVTAVPEPSTYALMAMGLMALGLARRRAQRSGADAV